MSIEMRKLMETVELGEADLTPEDLAYLYSKTQGARRIPINTSIRGKDVEIGEFSYQVLPNEKDEIIKYQFEGSLLILIPIDGYYKTEYEEISVTFIGFAQLFQVDDNEQNYEIHILTHPSLGYDRIEEIEHEPESQGKNPYEIFTQVLPNLIYKKVREAAEERPNDFLPEPMDRHDQEEGY